MASKLDRELDFDCPNCNLRWTPARCDEFKDGHYSPGPYIRCVECKNTYYRPIGETNG